MRLKNGTFLDILLHHRKKKNKGTNMRRFLKVVLPCFILSLSAEAALKKALLEEEIKTMIETIEREFYKNQPFTVFDVYKIVPQVILMENGDSKRPNSGLMPIEEDETELKMGVSVNAALLEIRDANAVLFCRCP